MENGYGTADRTVEIEVPVEAVWRPDGLPPEVVGVDSRSRFAWLRVYGG